MMCTPNIASLWLQRIKFYSSKLTDHHHNYELHLVRHDLSGEGEERRRQPIGQGVEGARAAGGRATTTLQPDRHLGAGTYGQEGLERRVQELGRPQHEAQVGNWKCKIGK